MLPYLAATARLWSGTTSDLLTLRIIQNLNLLLMALVSCTKEEMSNGWSWLLMARTRSALSEWIWTRLISLLKASQSPWYSAWASVCSGDIDKVLALPLKILMLFIYAAQPIPDLGSRWLYRFQAPSLLRFLQRHLIQHKCHFIFYFYFFDYEIKSAQGLTPTRLLACRKHKHIGW